MQLDLLKAEAALQSAYRAGVVQYREDDEIEIKTPHHQRIAQLLARISSSFDRPISVLDVGCGTGRYFYCLQNVERLVGMDISDEMLIAAENPVNGSRITARQIQLIRGNVFFASFSPGSFDFIYSFGMFGHGCPVTVEVCNKFHSWLAPDGQVFFDVVDVAGLPWMSRAKMQMRDALYPILPPGLQTIIDRRQKDTPFFGLTRRELENIVRASSLSEFIVCSHVCESSLWQGRHLECRAGLRALNGSLMTSTSLPTPLPATNGHRLHFETHATE